MKRTSHNAGLDWEDDRMTALNTQFACMATLCLNARFVTEAGA
ncbi:hypothetical protein [Celeribacter sp.]